MQTSLGREFHKKGSIIEKAFPSSQPDDTHRLVGFREPTQPSVMRELGGLEEDNTHTLLCNGSEHSGPGIAS